MALDKKEPVFRCVVYEVPGVGMKTLKKLVMRFGGGLGVWRASEGELQKTVGRKQTELIVKFRRRYNAEAAWERLQQAKIQVLAPEMETYPKRLLAITNPPPLLNVRGRLPDKEALTVVMVGTRRPTD